MPALALLALLLGQAAPTTAPGTEVRALTVTLLDNKDQEVTDVAASDVALLENGVSRPIVSFKPDRRPLSVAVLVDTSAAVGSAYRLNVVDAVTALIARLPEGSRYALWTTGDRPTKIRDFTDDRGAALAALRMVAPMGGNYMLDAFGEASRDLKKNGREGDRTALVAVSFMGPEFSSLDKYRAADVAQDDVDLVLSVQVEAAEGAEADMEMRTNVSYVMDRLAKTTGGRFETILSPMGLDGALRKVSANLRSAYRLLYATVPDLKKRDLDLRVARKDTKVLLPAASTREATPREPLPAAPGTR
jgi:VWFA-related protein